ncbi:hypothetical protein KCU75_g19904, partial [Aureobasidium melanogenum]
MDPLRLLTRSTKFAKKSTSTGPQIHTPSSGPASNPQLFDHGNESQGPNRKRKRGGETVTASLDFFGGGASAKEQDAEQNEQDASEEQSSLQQEQAAAPVAMSTEECKQLLGRHKVKISLFPNHDEAPAKKKKKEKADKDKKTSQSVGAQATPLYPAPV